MEYALFIHKSDDVRGNLQSRPSPSKRNLLHHQYAAKLVINPELTRALVSFQANKNAPFYSWLKYKEGFSSEFIQYILDKFQPSGSLTPRVLDPFAGTGTTLTTAASKGWEATGIELMPVGISAVRARLLAETINVDAFHYHLDRLEKISLDASNAGSFRFPHLRITDKAFPEETEQAISAYHSFTEEIDNADLRFLFRFACLSILEDISYTRKDGQYLRWDNRSERTLKSNFNKGIIRDFRTTITEKLHAILLDIKNQKVSNSANRVTIVEGSCLQELPLLPAASVDLVITSPPYCNRYDYTRTYALELAFLGYHEEPLKNLRQTLLSATVENRSKRKEMAHYYGKLNRSGFFTDALEAFTGQEALQEILAILREAQTSGKLNNNNIPNMVENYFFEMNLVIRELYRVIADGGRTVMVNDNVQYLGEEIPVDLILSDFASKAGFQVDQIWILPKGKGNSSQQMGVHGRNEIRKCVYVWSKPAR